jgi:anti-sigma factor RsiW
MTAECLPDDRAQELASRSPDRAEVAHINTCPACRALVEDYRTLGLSLSALRPPAPPAGFAEGVLAHLEARRWSDRRLWLWSLLLLGPATLVSGGSLWVMARSVGDGASLLTQAAALARALGSVAAALAPLQALLGLGCAVVCLPLLFAMHRLLPPAKDLAS